MMKDQTSFGPGFGTFEPGTKKLALSKEERTFKLRFYLLGMLLTPISTKKLERQFSQLISKKSSGIGSCVAFFQLKEREVLTGQRLNELEINGIRLTKFKMAKSGLNSSGLIPKTHQRCHRLGSKIDLNSVTKIS